MVKSTEVVNIREDVWGCGSGRRQFTVTTHSGGDGESWATSTLIRGDFTGLDLSAVREIFGLEEYYGGAGNTFAHRPCLRRKTASYMVFTQSGGLDI